MDLRSNEQIHWQCHDFYIYPEYHYLYMFGGGKHGELIEKIG